MKNRILIYSLVIIVLILISLNSCHKNDNNNLNSEKQVPTLTTSAISSITQTTVVCGGKITYDGGSTIKTRGVCWSTNPAPTLADSKTVNGTGPGKFNSDITNLTQNTTYYVRAYATNIAGTSYGNELSFIPGGNTVTDVDGNVYTLVTIGTQVWMKENLKTTKYRNGDTIPKVINNRDWAYFYDNAYCNYDNDTNNSTIYGRLYQWYVATDVRGICPIGWHVPGDAEWEQLTGFLGGGGLAGNKMKEADTTHWKSPNTGADNSSGFTGLPGGSRNGWVYAEEGIFLNIGYYGDWWSYNYYNGKGSSRAMGLNYSNANAFLHYKNHDSGASIRCLRD